MTNMKYGDLIQDLEEAPKLLLSYNQTVTKTER